MNKERLDQLLGFLKSGTKDPFIRYAIATEYNKQGRYEEALSYYRDLVNQDPDYVGTYYHFGKLLEQQGQAEQAISIYEQGMTVAKHQNNMHAFAELQGVHRSALGLAEDDDDEDY